MVLSLTLVTPILAIVLGVILAQLHLASASPGNSQCAHFCAANFPRPGIQCTSLAAHGGGPCYVCGPAAPPGHPDVCSSKCCNPSTPNCCNSACTDLQTDKNNCGTCGNVCTGGDTCVGGQCVCPGQVCTGGHVPSGCHSNNNCFCFQTIEGVGKCTGDFYCSNPTCSKSADCPAGTQCIVHSCCDRPTCGATACTPSTGPLPGLTLTRAKAAVGTGAGQ